MAAIIELGKFEQVPVRVAWPTEDENFTPWLAQPEAIAILGDALHLDLTKEATEHQVGIFRADIVARVSGETAHRVVIENQFGKTDHGHLGQILTYLAGIEDAKTVIWIAERIQADHRAAVDWLNTNTTDEYSFFAVEVELWRIGNSPPAPRFNVIASPNIWAKVARSASRDTALAERHKVRLAYWASFAEYLSSHAKQEAFRIRRENKNKLYRFPAGQPGFNIVAMIGIQRKLALVGLSADKAAFDALRLQKDQIDAEFGEKLDWQERPANKRSLIAIDLRSVNPADQSQYQHVHEWMLARIERFQKVFSERIKSLPLNDGAVLQDDGDSDDDE